MGGGADHPGRRHPAMVHRRVVRGLCQQCAADAPGTDHRTDPV